jgi:hypothetical protein
MKNLFLLAIVASSLLISCKKAEQPSPLLIRVKNNTSVSFKSVYVAENGIGSVSAGATSNYQSFRNVLAIPVAKLLMESGELIDISGRTCGNYMPMLENGKYRLEITTDISRTTSYKAEYVRE